MIRRPPRSTQSRSSAASDVYKRQVLDNLDPQVHGPNRETPEHLSRHARFIRGDVRDPETLWGCLSRADVVFHLAAAVGVSQSMYQVSHYASVNCQGTAELLELLANRPH